MTPGFDIVAATTSGSSVSLATRIATRAPSLQGRLYVARRSAGRIEGRDKAAAGLNAAWPRLSTEQKKLNPTFLSIVKDGFKAERIDDDEVSVARDNQILTAAQVGTLLRAARKIDGEHGFEGDLYRSVVCLAATGARFAQVRRMRVSDAQRKEQRLMVPGSYKGRGSNGGLCPGSGGQRCHRSPIAGNFRSPERGAAVRAMELECRNA
jgi:integrase